MPKQKIEIEVEVPEGYELTGEYRVPEVGEQFINSLGHANLPETGDTVTRRFILRKKFVWPGWLKAVAIAMEPTQNWYASSETPTLGKNGWLYNGQCQMLKPSELFDIDLPDVPKEKWRESLILNPNLQEGEE